MPIRIYLFGGPLMAQSFGHQQFDEWGEELYAFLQQSADAGMAATVVHTDFETPPERHEDILTMIANNVARERDEDE